MRLFKSPLFIMWLVGVLSMSIAAGWWWHPAAGLCLFGMLLWLDATLSGFIVGIRSLRRAGHGVKPRSGPGEDPAEHRR